ncbi:DNA adenine methylase [Paenibacillus sp. B-A-8]|uniref:DNA adenine methylase n=1 Tax=Paenibacillus sp. B-A-8 TaxID=3400419 RepID=UPI003B023F03
MYSEQIKSLLNGVQDPIPTLGGKSALMKTLIRIFDHCIYEYDLNIFGDLFLGGNRFHTHYKNYRITRIGNELDRGLLSYYRAIQDPDQFDYLISGIGVLSRPGFVAKEDFENFKVWRRDPSTDEVDAAILTYVVSKYSRAANRQDFNLLKAGEGIDIVKLRRKLTPLTKIYRDVQFLNEGYDIPFGQLIHRVDALIYLDPPYLTDCDSGTEETEGYDDKFAVVDHIIMLDQVVSESCKAKVIISNYFNELYFDYVRRGFLNCYFVGMVHVSSSGTGRKRPEFIFSNYTIPDYVLPPIPHEYRYYL